jgi:hypothetical protein
MAVNETAAAAFSSVTVGKPLGAVDVVGSGSPDVVAAPVDLPSWLMSVTPPRGIFA